MASERRASRADRISTPNGRPALVALMRARLQREGFPRALTLLMLASAGLCAFGVSVASLHAGLESMAVRYGAATLAGYVTFLLLLRCWIAARRHGVARVDFGDVLQWGADAATDDSVDAPARLFAGGGSGGAGGGDAWQPVPHSSPAAPTPGAAFEPPASLSLELDELWLTVLASVCALGGLAAIGYVVYMAPVLLAEIALDAALVTSIARRLRRQDAGHWAGAALRHTVVPALVLTAFMSVLGFALQQVAPGARSMGGAVRAVFAR